MALTRDQQTLLAALLKDKLLARIREETDSDIDTWTHTELILPMSDTHQEALYDDLLEQAIDAGIITRDTSNTRLGNEVTDLEAKRRI